MMSAAASCARLHQQDKYIPKDHTASTKKATDPTDHVRNNKSVVTILLRISMIPSALSQRPAVLASIDEIRFEGP